MNKAQLVERIATSAALTKTQAELVLNHTIENICSAVKRGEEVKIVGFGTFCKQKRKARLGRNPQTGKQIKIPSSWFPKFRPGADFKDLIN